MNEDDVEDVNEEEMMAAANGLGRNIIVLSRKVFVAQRLPKEGSNPPLRPPPYSFRSLSMSFPFFRNESVARKIRRQRSGRMKKGLPHSPGTVDPSQGRFISRPVISANGRWVVVNKFEEGEGLMLVRIDMANGREYPIAADENSYESYEAVCYIPAIDRFLLRETSFTYMPDAGGRIEREVIGAADGSRESRYLLLTPNTGEIRQPPGDVGPLAQQAFRPLQQAEQAHEFWAAMPDAKNDQTVIGIYDSKIFGFKPVTAIRGIRFNSMEMWVDRSGGRVLFAYKGHLLSAPLPK